MRSAAASAEGRGPSIAGYKPNCSISRRTCPRFTRWSPRGFAPYENRGFAGEVPGRCLLRRQGTGSDTGRDGSTIVIPVHQGRGKRSRKQEPLKSGGAVNDGAHRRRRRRRRSSEVLIGVPVRRWPQWRAVVRVVRRSRKPRANRFLEGLGSFTPVKPRTISCPSATVNRSCELLRGRHAPQTALVPRFWVNGQAVSIPAAAPGTGVRLGKFGCPCRTKHGGRGGGRVGTC